MDREYSPIDIGLDALGVQENENPFTALKLEGKSTDKAVALVNKRMESAMLRYPEMKSDILVAGMHVLLGLVEKVEDVQNIILPRLDRAVDRVAA
ncbi:hypothetical protein [Ralstonia pseudosolanacearum]|uniref:hypothetical protein n=1 Tax=Ralstonia pseudosolanacearum TaxID=1310165 RepID=UPI003CEB0841